MSYILYKASGVPFRENGRRHGGVAELFVSAVVENALAGIRVMKKNINFAAANAAIAATQ